MRQLMSGPEYRQALQTVDAGYADLAYFLENERRTTHRWLETGPPNTIARLLQLMMAKGWKLQHVERAIHRWVKEQEELLEQQRKQEQEADEQRRRARSKAPAKRRAAN